MDGTVVSVAWGTLAVLATVLALGACRSAAPSMDAGGSASAGAARWWKGNTHTHSYWSDGNDYPEMIADWYKRHGYHFVATTDHNPPPAERWVTIPAAGANRDLYDAYRARFGASWVEERRSGDTLRVRARRLDEYRGLLEEAGRFLLVPGEEITQYLGGKGAHMNGINLAEPIAPQEGATLVEILQRDLNVIRAQRERTGHPMIGVLNHPNFLWSQTAEDLLALADLRFFELYNGHPLVNNQGDSLHAGTERIWDIVLTGRFARGGGPLYGVATDDAHDYLRVATEQRNPGRGWIMVRAPELSAGALIAALERGDFYASTGVTLARLERAGRTLNVDVEAEQGVAYTIQFVGTRSGYDTASTPVHDSAGTALTGRYSPDIGAILAEVRGPRATYTMRGDELYVRARVVSSKPAANPSYPGEVQMACTQPARP
ncbi:MAG TPA: hypothetical protein VMM18_05260 [Gemmatimonadaceae bacterium]|nr:hypothetical protein [Gemmatimonadaceae bacterium]